MKANKKQKFDLYKVHNKKTYHHTMPAVAINGKVTSTISKI
jgi:hypothetical protein